MKLTHCYVRHFPKKLNDLDTIDDFSAALSGAAVFYLNTCKFYSDVLYL